MRERDGERDRGRESFGGERVRERKRPLSGDREDILCAAIGGGNGSDGKVGLAMCAVGLLRGAAGVCTLLARMGLCCREAFEIHWSYPGHVWGRMVGARGSLSVLGGGDEQMMRCAAGVDLLASFREGS